MPNLVINKKREYHVTNLPAQSGAEDITRVKEGQDDKRGSQEEDLHDWRSFTGSAAEMEMGRERCQNASSTMDAANDNVGPENRTMNGRENKDEVDRRLQNDSRDAVVNTS